MDTETYFTCLQAAEYIGMIRNSKPKKYWNEWEVKLIEEHQQLMKELYQIIIKDNPNFKIKFYGQNAD